MVKTEDKPTRYSTLLIDNQEGAYFIQYFDSQRDLDEFDRYIVPGGTWIVWEFLINSRASYSFDFYAKTIFIEKYLWTSRYSGY